MAVASVKQAPVPVADMDFGSGVETALYYVEAALEAHMGSFSESEEKNRKFQWAVTGLLERAVQLLHKDQFGEE